MNITINLDGFDKPALLALCRALEEFYYSEDFNCPACDSCNDCPTRESCDSVLNAKVECLKLGNKRK